MFQLLEVSDDINSIVTNQSHYDIMLVHLIEKFHGPRGILNIFSEEKKEWWNSFESFWHIQKSLEVRFCFKCS